jgi:hypothetical protein
VTINVSECKCEALFYFLHLDIFGAFVKQLRKATLILCPTAWNSGAPTGRIFVGVIFVIPMKSCRYVLILVEVGQAAETSDDAARTLSISVRDWSI